MLYEEALVGKNGQIDVVNQKVIDQNKLTSDCWPLQFNGLSACQTCEFRDTKDCGGGQTLADMLV